ncbi:MAG TPA: MCE family protein [Pseudonocardia sp.]|jgi:phospholipid/cholesterol/gamma-HCH transport system substrate-binding protein
MITRATMIRAILFVVISVVLVVYIGGRYLHVFNFIPPQGYTVMVPLPAANGLFYRSEVDYRGVKIGDLGEPELTQTGTEVPLNIAGSAAPIPKDLKVVIVDRSAAGERYVNLLPNTNSGPFLADGDRIPADRVAATPVQVQSVLLSLNQLAASVPLDDLRTVVNQLGIGFDQLGPKLQLLLDSTNSLVKTTQDILPQTTTLIRDTSNVLATQNTLADPIKSFSSDLRKVTAQLKASDPDIRRLTNTGPEAGHQVTALLHESRPGLDDTIRRLGTTTQILDDHERDIQSILQLYAGLAAAIPTILPGDGTAHLGLALNVNDPPACTKGYEASDRQPGAEITPPHPLNYRAFCREPIFSPIMVRGFKPQYPFVNGRPQTPPDWFFAFYQHGGPATGVFEPRRH